MTPALKPCPVCGRDPSAPNLEYGWMAIRCEPCDLGIRVWKSEADRWLVKTWNGLDRKPVQMDMSA